jgi:hypothetical protein
VRRSWRKGLSECHRVTKYHGKAEKTAPGTQLLTPDRRAACPKATSIPFASVGADAWDRTTGCLGILELWCHLVTGCRRPSLPRAPGGVCGSTVAPAVGLPGAMVRQAGCVYRGSTPRLARMGRQLDGRASEQSRP